MSDGGQDAGAEKVKPIQGWFEFLNRIKLLSEKTKHQQLLTKKVRERFAQDRVTQFGEFGNVCEAIGKRNSQFVWDAYSVYLDTCVYNTLSFQNKGRLSTPLVGSVHYGCGLLGKWQALTYRPHEEYFQSKVSKDSDGWSTLTASARKVFDNYYRNELPLRAHLASNPFLSIPIAIYLDAAKDTNKNNVQGIISNICASLGATHNVNFIYFGKNECQQLHNWFLHANDLDEFLDGRDFTNPNDEWLINDETNDKFLFSRNTWNDIISCLEGATSGLLPEKIDVLNETQIANMSDDQKKKHELDKYNYLKSSRHIALRTIITAIYSALHLIIFSNKSAIKTSIKDVKGILACIAPLYTRPGMTDQSMSIPGYEYCDFANYIAGYAITDVNSGDYNIESSLKSFMNQLQALERTVSCFARIEQLALTYQSGAGTLTTENVIRECCIINHEVLRHVNKWQPWFDNNLKPFAEQPSDFIAKLTKNDIMVGASSKITDLLERIGRHVSSRYKMNNCGQTCSKLAFKSIFLYSEPGCGKENIAKIIHLIGQTYKKNRVTSRVTNIIWEKPDNYVKLLVSKKEAQNPWLEEWLQNWNDFDKEKIDVSFSGGSSDNDPPTGVNILNNKNYYVLNCGVVKNDADFNRVFFGELIQKENSSTAHYPVTGSGAVLAAQLTGGSVFFDEFNTLDKRFDSKFLRFLEKPYRFTVNMNRNLLSFDAEILIIMASNKDQKQLIEELNFNPAVVFRATENFFRIPPLRERKEDIAVFVLHQLLAKKKSAIEAQQSMKCVTNIHRISTEGMRLICEMDWKENYRGVRSFINTLIENREIRKIEDSVVSFEEVLEALTKMDALHSGAAYLKESGSSRPTIIVQ